MRRLIAVASAALALACAGSASAATHIIDFEGYTPGDATGGGPWPGSEIAGTPFPLAFAKGVVVNIPTPGLGNVLAIDIDAMDDATLWFRDFRTGVKTDAGQEVYAPRLKSIDIFVPLATHMHFSELGVTQLAAGQWFTYTPDEILKGTYRLRISDVPFAYIDNIVLEDNFAIVPEPATWAMMIVGFGLAGAAIRRQPVGKLVVRAS